MSFFMSLIVANSEVRHVAIDCIELSCMKFNSMTCLSSAAFLGETPKGTASQYSVSQIRNIKLNNFNMYSIYIIFKKATFAKIMRIEN